MQRNNLATFKKGVPKIKLIAPAIGMVFLNLQADLRKKLIFFD
jgi:hypothetical protein